MSRLAAALHLHGAALGPVAFERRTGGRSADRGEGLGAPHGCVMRALEACHCLSASLACAPRFMLANASVFAVACASHAMCSFVPRLRHSIPGTVVRRTWVGWPPFAPADKARATGGVFQCCTWYGVFFAHYLCRCVVLPPSPLADCVVLKPLSLERLKVSRQRPLRSDCCRLRRWIAGLLCIPRLLSFINLQNNLKDRLSAVGPLASAGARGWDRLLP